MTKPGCLTTFQHSHQVTRSKRLKLCPSPIVTVFIHELEYDLSDFAPDMAPTLFY